MPITERRNYLLQTFPTLPHGSFEEHSLAINKASVQNGALVLGGRSPFLGKAGSY